MGMFDSTKDFWNGGGSKVADAMTFGAAGTLFHPNADKADTSGDQAARNASIADLKGAMPTSYDGYQSTGEYNPTLLGAMPQQGDTEYGNISVDPSTRAAQMQALAQLQSRSTDGYNDQDRAAIAQTLNETAQQEASQRGALQASMQARGVGGSGAELAAQLANQQGAATRNNTAALNIAANGRAQALQAAMQSGQLGGQIHGQDYSEQAQKAAAQDAIKKFNTTAGINTAMTNNATTNDAAKYNTNANQALANAKVDQGNNFQQQKFGNQGTITGIQYGASTNDANQKIAQSAADQAKIDADKDRYINTASKVASFGAKAAGGA